MNDFPSPLLVRKKLKVIRLSRIFVLNFVTALQFIFLMPFMLLNFDANRFRDVVVVHYLDLTYFLSQRRIREKNVAFPVAGNLMSHFSPLFVSLWCTVFSCYFHSDVRLYPLSRSYLSQHLSGRLDLVTLVTEDFSFYTLLHLVAHYCVFSFLLAEKCAW